MERTQVLDLMGTRKLYGMRSAPARSLRAFARGDEVMAEGIKRQHEQPRLEADVLQSEIAEIEPACRHRFETAGEGPDPSATK